MKPAWLGDCPYYTKRGDEGAYGPNTCSYGCSDEPECQTYQPPDGWGERPQDSEQLELRNEG